MSEFHDIVIVGAGFSGLGTAIALREAGFDDILIVDDASGPGGVWRWNTYPGVAVDIPSFSYQFSYDQRPNWSRTYAPGAELRSYAERLVEVYGLEKHLRFNTAVRSASFDEQKQEWAIENSGGPLAARWLIHAGGPLTRPKMPDIEGIDTFEGDWMHTSRWDHTVDLSGKRVGIIGTGASAVQVIPKIAPMTKHLTVFQRTPIWCLPKLDLPLPKPVQLGMSTIPFANRVARAVSQGVVEVTFPLTAHYRQLMPLAPLTQRAARRFIASQVKDRVTREKLTPTYALGCKRPSFHNSYLKTFNRPDVELETNSIQAITPSGIRTADGTVHELDVLIFATGFKVTDKDAIPTYALSGREGADLAEDWDENRLRSYQGVSVSGYPNFFSVFGPYGYNGASFFTLIENSAAHIVRVLQEAQRRSATYAEVTQAAENAYMTDMLSRGKRGVFVHPTCQSANSYYFTKKGEVPFRASTTVEAAWRSRHFPLRDYTFSREATTA